LFVIKKARGLGVAKNLMSAANALALETNANANGITLETSADNYSA